MKITTIFAIFSAFLMLSGIFILVAYIPVSNSHNSPVASPYLADPTANIYQNASYYVNTAESNSGTTTVDVPIDINGTATTWAFSTSSTWTANSADTSASLTMTSQYRYFSSASNSVTVSIQDFAFFAGLYYDSASATYMSSIGQVWANMTFGGVVYSWASPVFNDLESTSNYYVYISPGWNIHGNTNYYEYAGTVSITFTCTDATNSPWDGSSNAPTYGYSTPTNSGANTVSTTVPSSEGSAVTGVTGYYVGATQTSTFTIPQYETSFNINLGSSPVTNIQAKYDGTVYNLPGTATGVLTVNSLQVGDINGGDPAISSNTNTIAWSYNLTNQNEAIPTTTNSFYTVSPAFTISLTSGTTNEFNSSKIAWSFSNPSNAFYGAYETTASSLTTTNGIVTYTGYVSGLSQLYSTLPQNSWQWSFNSGSYVSQSSASSHTVTLPSQTQTAAGTISNNIVTEEFANTNPTVTQPTVSFSGTGTTADISFSVSQPDFSGESQTATVYFGDGTSQVLTGTPGSFSTTHSYSGDFSGALSHTYSIYVVDANNPNPASNGLSTLSATSPTITYTISTSIVVSPLATSRVNVGQSIYFNYTALNWNPATLHLTVNRVSETAATTIGTSAGKGSWVNSFNTPLTVSWALQGGGITETYSLQYSSNLYPFENSTYINVAYSTTTTKQFPITISSPPSGTGYYQQLITLNATNDGHIPSYYGINSQASNFQIALPNSTLLYTWIQSFNATSLTMWVKVPYGTSQVELQVLPSFENVLSATGYVGEAPVYGQSRSQDNGRMVFDNNDNKSFYDSFSGSSLNSSIWDYTSGALTYTMHDGLNVTALDTQNGLWTKFNATGQGQVYFDINYIQSSNYIDLGWQNVSHTNPTSYGSSYPVAGYIQSYENSTFMQAGSTSLTSSVNTKTFQTSRYFATYEVSFSGDTYTATKNNSLSYSLTSSLSIPTSQIGFFGSTGTFSEPTLLNYIFAPVSLSSMPTTSIGSGSVFQANFSTVTQIPYQTINPYPTNGSLNEVTYSVPVGSFNVSEVFYNDTWTFLSAAFSATSSAVNQPVMRDVLMTGVTLNPYYITFIEPVVQKKTNDLHVSQVRGLPILKPNTQTNYSFSLTLNGASVSSGLMSTLVMSGNFRVFNAVTGVFVSVGTLSSVNSTLNVSFYTIGVGNYYYVLQSNPEYSGSAYLLQYGGTFNVTTAANFSNGLHLSIAGVPSFVQHRNTTYLLTAKYNNGTLLNGTDSASVLLNMTAQIDSGTTELNAVTPHKTKNGTFAFFLNISDPGNFFLVVSVSPTYLGTLKASAQNEIAFNVTNTPISVQNGMRMSVSVPSNTIQDVPYLYLIDVMYSNSTPMNRTDTLLVLSHSNVTVYNFSTPIDYGKPYYIQPGIIGVNLSLPTGTWFGVASISGTQIGSQNVSAKKSFSIPILPRITIGIKISISGTTPIQEGHASVYIVTITENSGGYIDYSQTKAIASGLVLNVYLNNSYIISPLPYVQQPGKLYFILNLSKTGQYTVFAGYNGTIGNLNATASTSFGVQVVSYNPSSGSFGSFFNNLIDNPIVRLVVETVGGILIAYVVGRIYFWIRGMRKTDAKEIANSAKGYLIAKQAESQNTPVVISKREMKEIKRDLREGN